MADVNWHKLYSWPNGILKILQLALGLCAVISTAASHYEYAGAGLTYFTGINSMIWCVVCMVIMALGMEDRVNICSLAGVFPFILMDFIESVVATLFFGICFILAAIGAGRASANGAAAFFCAVLIPLWGFNAYVSFKAWRVSKDNPQGGPPGLHDPPPPYPGGMSREPGAKI